MVNSSITFFAQIINIVLKFILQTIFVKTLGTTYLGINGLFSNVLTILSFAELGIGTAITFSLYRPLANDDQETLNIIMAFFKKAYRIIALVVAVIGLLLLPLLPFMVKGHVDNLYYIYLLFLSNSVISYFFSYKRSLLLADQNAYINIINQLEFVVLQVVLQVVVLLTLKDFMLYLCIQIVCTILSNVSISKKVDSLYPFLNEDSVSPLPTRLRDEIKSNTIGMMGSRIGGIAITGTDNLIISAFIGVHWVGLYSNYFLITNSITAVLTQAVSSVSSSIGNLANSSSKEKTSDVFEKHLFINFFLTYFSTVFLIGLLNPFISIWLGSNLMLSNSVVMLIVVNFMVNQFRQTSLTFISGLGLFAKVGIKSILEAVINLVITVVLVREFHMGLSGVFIGTLVSNLLINVWYEPWIVMKYGIPSMNKFMVVYKYILYNVVTIITMIIVQYMSISFFEGGILSFVKIGLFIFIIASTIFVIVFGNSKEFKYSYWLIKTRVLKR